MDRRADQHDAKVAARQADGAEADAADAIEFAAWTVDHARLAVLDAIDAGSTPTSSPSKRPSSRGPAVAAMARDRRPPPDPGPSPLTLGWPSSGRMVSITAVPDGPTASAGPPWL
jgi:hypothetical protein